MKTVFISDEYAQDLMARGWKDWELHRVVDECLYDICAWYRLGWDQCVHAGVVKEWDEKDERR